jgi:hypothetical protein
MALWTVRAQSAQSISSTKYRYVASMVSGRVVIAAQC